MASKEAPERHYIHFMTNGVAGFVEIEPNGSKWCHFPIGHRIAYGAIQGKLNRTVHSVMIQLNLISAWRG